MTEDLVVKKGSELTLDEVKAMLEAKVEAAVQRAMETPTPEAAEPFHWWNIFAMAPLQPGAGTVPPKPIGVGHGPWLPHKIIRVGEPAYVQTVIWLNPFWGAGGLTACNMLSNARFQYEVNYYTSDLINMAPSTPTAQNLGRFTPNVCRYIDVLRFVPTKPGLFAMNITARIHDAEEKPMTPFAAFATEVWDFDWELFAPQPRGPHWVFDQPIRFMVYE